MSQDDDLRELSKEEDKIKLYWGDVIKHIRRYLAYIWTDEVKRDFNRIKTELGKITFIFKKLHQHYKTNEEWYKKEIMLLEKIRFNDFVDIGYFSRNSRMNFCIVHKCDEQLFFRLAEEK